LLIASEFPPGPGGIGIHAHQLAVHLQEYGWQIEVVAPQAYVTVEARNCFNAHLPFPITSLSSLSTGQRLKQIWQKTRMFRPGVIVASGGRPLWVTALLSTFFQIPWLAVGHGSEFLNSSPISRFLTHQAIRRANQVVAVSQYTAQMVANIRPTNITSIPNGADGDRFRPDLSTQKLRQQLGLVDKRILLTVGNISKRKAQDVVIRALPRVLTHCPDVIYLIVGLPTRQKELTQMAQNCGVADRVCFVGVVSHEFLPTYYNLCDLFVLVSREAHDGDVEGYGIVVVEAAMCGKTAVVSNHGGLPEAVHHGETGLIVPTESPEATAEAIITLLTDEAQRQSLAQRALNYAAEATWAKRIATYDSILRGMVV
jgi:phosphatidylinositol alpha-1,6-mannosyltransferase